MACCLSASSHYLYQWCHRNILQWNFSSILCMLIRENAFTMSPAKLQPLWLDLNVLTHWGWFKMAALFTLLFCNNGQVIYASHDVCKFLYNLVWFCWDGKSEMYETDIKVMAKGQRTSQLLIQPNYWFGNLVQLINVNSSLFTKKFHSLVGIYGYVNACIYYMGEFCAISICEITSFRPESLS